jgi:hypothetical protein
MRLSYIHLPAGREPPSIAGVGPFKAVLVLDQAVTEEWQGRVCAWLVRSGCLYMMAWGTACSAWHDSVDYAALSAVDFNEAPDDKFVMTTWHDDEPLREAFWFASHVAHHPTVLLSDTIIIDIGGTEREAQLLEAYSSAQDETL